MLCTGLCGIITLVMAMLKLFVVYQLLFTMKIKVLERSSEKVVCSLLWEMR